MKTDDLIRRLVADVRPVRRLPPPWLRAAQWLAVAVPAVALVVLLVTPRADLAEKLTDTRFLIEQAAAIATAVTAAIAAFSLVIPGSRRGVALLPVFPLAVWLASLGQGCVSAWLRSGGEAIRLYPDWMCFPYIALVGAAPALAIVLMLRRGSPLTPRLTVALGALAAAALGSFGLRLFHTQDASLMVLVWQFGSVALLSVLAGWGGGRILRWPRRAVMG